MKYFVAADPHGFCTRLEEALREKGFFDAGETAPLILCGDLLDRGDEAQRIVDLMLDLKRQKRLIYILGNHEDLLVDSLQSLSTGDVYSVADSSSHHFLNGTWDTLLQLAEMSAREAYYDPFTLARRVMRSPFYRELLPYAVDYFETPHYVFTHGYLPSIVEGFGKYARRSYDPNWREADFEAWKKARWYNGMEMAMKRRVRETGKTVVCGHWHASYGHAVIDRLCPEYGEGADFSPYYGDGVIAIDACTAVSGVVNCIIIED